MDGMWINNMWTVCWTATDATEILSDYWERFDSKEDVMDHLVKHNLLDDEDVLIIPPNEFEMNVFQFERIMNKITMDKEALRNAYQEDIK